MKMKGWMIAALMTLFSGAVTAQEPALSQRIDFELYDTPLPQAITLIYGEVFNRPFMLDPQLAQDKRILSFKLTPAVDARAFITRYMNNLNVKISTRNGVDYLMPFVPVQKTETVIWHPRYRSVEYLSDMLGSQLSGSQQVAGVATGIQPDAQNGQGKAVAVASGIPSGFNRKGDMLVYTGTPANAAHVRTLLPQTDTPAGQILVTGYVFEVQDTQRNGSGLALVASLLSGKLGIEAGTEQGSGNLIRLSTGSLNALFELFKTDSRFHVLSSPQLRVMSGASASFSVGADVPVLGSVSYQDGQPVQSVEYRSSGVLFNVTPQIREKVIDMQIQQQISDFVKTDTGVNGSPTLTKRDVSTRITDSDGDVIILGVLAESKATETKKGFSFLPFFTGKSAEKMRSDIIVVMQLKQMP